MSFAGCSPYYTVVIFNNASATSSITYEIYIDQTVYAKYDFAAHADDLGMIPMNGSSIVSNTDNLAAPPAFSPTPDSTLLTHPSYIWQSKSTVPIPMPENYNIRMLLIPMVGYGAGTFSVMSGLLYLGRHW